MASIGKVPRSANQLITFMGHGGIRKARNKERNNKNRVALVYFKNKIKSKNGT